MSRDWLATFPAPNGCYFVQVTWITVQPGWTIFLHAAVASEAGKQQTAKRGEPYCMLLRAGTDSAIFP
jgi:hypothetical protein